MKQSRGLIFLAVSIFTSFITTVFLYFGWIPPIGALLVILGLGGLSIIKLNNLEKLYQKVFRPLYSYAILGFLILLIIRGLAYTTWIQSIPILVDIIDVLGKIEIILVAHIIALAWVLTALDKKFGLIQLETSTQDIPRKNIQGLTGIFKYIFLILLLILSISSVTFLKDTYFGDILALLRANQFLLAFLTVNFGAMTFYLHQDEVIATELEEAENRAEDKKGIQFDKKFSILAKVPILKSVFRWFYKQGWVYNILFVLSVLLGIYLRLKDIFLKSPWADEGYSMMAAQRIAEGLGNTFPSGNLYGRAPIYHEYLAIFFKIFESPYGYGVIANIPFFILSCFIIYILTKESSNKKFAILGVILFSFSWFAIGHFRMIRMYEAFISGFLLTTYFLLKIFIQYYNLKLSISIKSTIKNIINVIIKNIYSIILFIVFFYLSYDTNELVGMMIPAIIIGSFLFTILKPKLNLFLLFILTSIIWVIALIARYGSEFVNFLVVQSLPPWAANYEVKPFLDIWKYLTNNGHYYLFISLIILVSIIFTNRKIFTKKYKIIFLLLFTFGFYSIVALQGIGSIAPRYFYPFLPLAIIISSISFYYLFSLFKHNSKSSLILIYMILIVLGVDIYNSGIKESNSILNKNSKIGVNNMEYREFFNEINKLNLNYDNFILAGDSHISVLFYIEKEIELDFIIIRNRSYYNVKDFYLNSTKIGFKDFEQLVRDTEKEILFLYDGQWNIWQEGRSAIFSNDHIILAEYGRMKLIKYIKN